VVKDRIQRYGLQTETLKAIGFEAKFFQLDIQVAPEGVSRREIARTIWEEFEAEIVILPDPDPAEEAALYGNSQEQNAGDEATKEGLNTGTEASVEPSDAAADAAPAADADADADAAPAADADADADADAAPAADADADAADADAAPDADAAADADADAAADADADGKVESE
jgi:hypothetical protein